MAIGIDGNLYVCLKCGEKYMTNHNTPRKWHLPEWNCPVDSRERDRRKK